ncbi:hypothetical protein GCM10011588_08690 [Nocardia jinanensis]|uniref:Uncharacterized protein n=1 Tax=Nocardia jinanensis TaxID=382504 RepID=A0A917R966_9NOCA|nr:hypothetical protein GCM10011588_08690 [Nocardia jinanensis]
MPPFHLIAPAPVGAVPGRVMPECALIAGFGFGLVPLRASAVLLDPREESGTGT